MKLFISELAKSALTESFEKVATATQDPIAKIVFVDEADYEDIAESYWTLGYYDGEHFPPEWRATVDGFNFVIEPGIFPEGVNAIYLDSDGIGGPYVRLDQLPSS